MFTTACSWPVIRDSCGRSWSRRRPRPRPRASSSVRVPVGDDGPVALASLWRRQGGRVRAGLAEVVTVEVTRRVVTRSIHGSGALTLTTTCDAMDGGCLVEQRLEGSAAGHAGERVAKFALLWLQRGLIDLKERLEADPGRRPERVSGRPTGDRPQVERYASRLARSVTSTLRWATPDSSRSRPRTRSRWRSPPEELWDLLMDPRGGAPAPAVDAERGEGRGRGCRARRAGRRAR